MTGDPNHAPGMTDDIYLDHDGDGRMLKRLQKDYLPLEESWGYHWVDRPLQYYVRSTVLGGAVLSEVNHTGKKLKTYVNAGGQTIAWQALVHPEQGSSVEMLRFEHYDPAGMSRRMTIENGNATGVEGLESDAAEFDPAGQSVGLWDPYPELPPPFPGEGCIGCGSNGIMGVDDNSQIYVNGFKMRCRDTTTNQIMSCQNLLSLKAIVGDKHNNDVMVDKGLFVNVAIVGVDPWVLQHFGVLRVPRILEGEARTRPTYLFVPKRQTSELQTTANESARPNRLPKCIIDYLHSRWGLDLEMLRSVTYSTDGLPSVGTIAGSVRHLNPVLGTIADMLPGNTLIDAGAITVDDHIYFQSTGNFNASDGISAAEIALVGHEVRHVEQYRSDPSFRVKYAGHFIYNLGIRNTFTRGLAKAFRNSYTQIPFEEQAEAFGRLIRDDIDENGNPCEPLKAKAKGRFGKRGKRRRR